MYLLTPLQEDQERAMCIVGIMAHLAKWVVLVRKVKIMLRNNQDGFRT